jgi:hypothetical protein
MSADPDTLPSRRSRRALLAAAAAGAAGAVASRLATPDDAAAASVPLMTEATTPTSATTRINGTGADEVFVITATGVAPALQVSALQGAGIVAATQSSSIGVAGFGLGSSGYGMAAISLNGAGLLASNEPSIPPTAPAAAIYARVSNKARVGIQAEGRVVLPDRSGRKNVPAGASSVTVNVTGVAAGNIAVASIAAIRPGRWVSSVVCSAGKVTIRLNGKVATRTPVSWIVLG